MKTGQSPVGGGVTATPIPLKATRCGLPEALVRISRVAVRLPAALGANRVFVERNRG